MVGNVLVKVLAKLENNYETQALTSQRRGIVDAWRCGSETARRNGRRTKAKMTKEPFGDLRIYYDGPTEQLKSMTAGSLRLNPGPNRIRLTSIRKRSSCSSPKEPAR